MKRQDGPLWQRAKEPNEAPQLPGSVDVRSAMRRHQQVLARGDARALKDPSSTRHPVRDEFDNVGHDIANQLDSDTAFFKLSDSGSPTVIQDRDGSNALYVLMPMRV